MNIYFYTILFIIGIMMGCYWAIHVNKISKTLDMKKTNYNNSQYAELISALTYILLGGTISVILANILEIQIEKIEIFKCIIYIFAMLYITALVLVGGIDRVYTKIEKRTLGMGIICSIVYIIYLSVIDLASLYLSAIYLGIYIILLVLDTFLLRKYAKDSYIVNILMLLNMILTFTDLRILIYTLSMAFIAVIIYILIQKLQKKKYINRKNKVNEIPIGYFIASSNIIVLFFVRIFENYLI